MSEPTEERDTKSIAGKFAEALGCIEDAAHWLDRIDEQFEKRYPNDIDYGDPSEPFWAGICMAITTLDLVQDGLKEAAKYMPKEVTA